MDNIILIGFMGSGKTEVGRLLAKDLKLKYVDTDALIEAEQHRSINEIFEKNGEPAFREMESKMIEALKGKKGRVISTGGGIILRPENVKKLKKLGTLVLLWADPETVHKRVRDTGDRPLLNVADPLAKIREILSFREPIYRSVADFAVDTSRLSPEDACNRIKKCLEEEK